MAPNDFDLRDTLPSGIYLRNHKILIKPSMSHLNSTAKGPIGNFPIVKNMTTAIGVKSRIKLNGHCPFYSSGNPSFINRYIIYKKP